MRLSSPLTKFLGSGHPRLVAKCAGFAMGLALVVSACAQQPATPPSPAQVHVQSRTSPVHHKEGRPQAPDRGPRPEAPTDAAPKPPQVTLDAGTLTIDANNSDLSTIIEKVAHESGMTVDGLDKSGRVFGVYGPGAPRLHRTMRTIRMPRTRSHLVREPSRIRGPRNPTISIRKRAPSSACKTCSRCTMSWSSAPSSSKTILSSAWIEKVAPISASADGESSPVLQRRGENPSISPSIRPRQSTPARDTHKSVERLHHCRHDASA